MNEKKPNEPVRHHYIPQFILNNFTNDNNQVQYWDVRKNNISTRNPKSIFMNFNMYRDEINNPHDPTIIEKRFAQFESEISCLVKEKIIDKTEVVITRAELEKLRIFLELLSFRSDLRMNQYKQKNFSLSTEVILAAYQPDKNYEDLWKKELRELVDCRSFKEIEDSKTLDPIIKQDFMNSINGFYMTIVDARGGEFILSDIYPTLEIYPLMPNVNIHLHAFYPISPTRMLLINHIIFKKEANKQDLAINAMVERSRIRGQLLKQPKPKYKMAFGVFLPEDTFSYTPVKVYENDLTYINALILNEARNGLMFRNADKILNSIHRFNERDDTKIKHYDFEKVLS